MVHGDTEIRVHHSLGHGSSINWKINAKKHKSNLFLSLKKTLKSSLLSLTHTAGSRLPAQWLAGHGWRRRRVGNKVSSFFKKTTCFEFFFSPSSQIHRYFLKINTDKA